MDTPNLPAAGYVPAATVLEYLAIKDRRTLARMIDAGLPVVYLTDGIQRFRLDEVDAWARSRREAAA